MKKIYLKPATDVVSAALSSLLTSSTNPKGKAMFEVDNQVDAEKSDKSFTLSGNIEKMDGGESFSKGNSFSSWDEE